MEEDVGSMSLAVLFQNMSSHTQDGSWVHEGYT